MKSLSVSAVLLLILFLTPGNWVASQADERPTPAVCNSIQYLGSAGGCDNHRCNAGCVKRHGADHAHGYCFFSFDIGDLCICHYRC
ncbi:hypothetical protein V6N13_095556 [Hibiscus sabdariffa]|uniref:Uncharacterized protein n=2 Tax=Hibiscus sabdariffa TaxID=183260 RepID=A0ABR2AJH9_9ROSI